MQTTDLVSLSTTRPDIQNIAGIYQAKGTMNVMTIFKMKFLLVYVKNVSLVGQIFIIVEASQSHSGTLQSVGLLWTSDQPNTDLYMTTHKTHNRQTSMPLEAFEPTVSSSEWLRTHTLNSTVTGIGKECVLPNQNMLNNTMF